MGFRAGAIRGNKIRTKARGRGPGVRPVNGLLFLNGEFMDIADGRVSVEDRGFVYADGIYEVLRIYGGRAFAVEEHLERLARSARGVMLDLPRPIEEYPRLFEELIARSGIVEGTIYGQITRGAAPRSHPFPPAGTPPTEMWWIKPFEPATEEARERGVGAILLEADRWGHCDWKTIALLPNILAKERARRLGAVEAIFISADGIVHECAASNLFAVWGDVVRTHPLCSKLLPGVTRRVLVESAAEAGMPIREEPFHVRRLLEADELFLTSTTFELMPITQVDGRAVGSGRRGAVTKALHEIFRARVTETCATGAQALYG